MSDIIHLSILTDKQKEALNQLHALFPDLLLEELIGFLRYRNYDVTKAELQIRSCFLLKKIRVTKKSDTHNNLKRLISMDI